MYAVEIEGIRHTYPAGRKTPARVALKGIDLSIDKGEMFGFLGPNGSGKTTLFKILSTLIAPTEGTARILGVDITSRVSEARKSIGVVFQHPSLDRKLTVEENLLAIMEAIGMKAEDRKRRCTELLDELNIANIARNKGYNLSGGERRRTEIARTLVTEPKFILLDEPFAGVDPISVLDIKKIIEHLKNRGIGVLITDHNVRETLDVCEKAYIVSHGELIASGTPDYVLNDKTVRDVYLGEQFKL